jgi:threonine/homoserine/homoserine lactone efflux protein
MELTAWISLATVCLMGAMTPGPSLAVVLKHTVNGGRANGVVSGIAHGLGVGVYAVFTVLGLALVIKESPMVFNAIRYAGVLFILWLAFKAFTAKSGLANMGESGEKVSLWASLREGWLIAFVNPKLAIFFLALFSQFIQADAGWVVNAILVSTVGFIDMIWYILIALILSQSTMLEKLRNHMHIVEKLTGIALLAVAARVML